MRTEDEYPYYQDPNAARHEDEAGEEADADTEIDAEDDDYAFDPLGPDEHDAHLLEEDAREDEVHCPACGELTYDDTPQCANCGHWISDSEHAKPSATQNLVTGAIVAVLILAMLLFVTRLF